MGHSRSLKCGIELELELVFTRVIHKPVLRVNVHAHAQCASKSSPDAQITKWTSRCGWRGCPVGWVWLGHFRRWNWPWLSINPGDPWPEGKYNRAFSPHRADVSAGYRPEGGGPGDWFWETRNQHFRAVFCGTLRKWYSWEGKRRWKPPFPSPSQ